MRGSQAPTDDRPGGLLAGKVDALCDTLRSLRSVVVAYSGGVDSAYLAYMASRTLGDRALAITADSPSYPARHRRLALDVAARVGLRHEFIHTQEIARAEYRANSTDRCYLQARALHASLPHRRRVRRHHCRRQQCRRSRRLPAGPAGGP